MEAPAFTCSICGEPSHDICAYCTKDACPNHLCERCGRCSDCCECEVRALDAGLNGKSVADTLSGPKPALRDQG